MTDSCTIDEVKEYLVKAEGQCPLRYLRGKGGDLL